MEGLAKTQGASDKSNPNTIIPVIQLPNSHPRTFIGLEYVALIPQATSSTTKQSPIRGKLFFLFSNGFQDGQTLPTGSD